MAQPHPRIATKENFRVYEKQAQSRDKVVFVFTAMGTKIGLYALFARLMNRRGYTCIIYDYPLRLVHDANIQEWKLFFDTITADAQQRIAKHRKLGANHFYAYGVSMGTLMANKSVRDTPVIKHVILNLTYGDLASNLFTWTGVKKTRMNLERQGMDVLATRKEMAYVDPIATAADLKGKKVMLCLSRRDRVQVCNQTKYTLRAFRENELDLVYRENKLLGHFIGCAKNMLSIKSICNFYES